MKNHYMKTLKCFSFALGMFAIPATSVSAQVTVPAFSMESHLKSTADMDGCYVTTDVQGNVYMAGRFSKPLILSSEQTFEGKGGNDVYVIKYDQELNILWAKTFGGTASEEARSIDISPAGDVCVSGFFNGTITIEEGITLTTRGGQDGYAIVFDGNTGAVKKTMQFGDGTADYVGGAAFDKNGNMYVTGYFTGEVNFGEVVKTSTAKRDVFVAKYTPSYECQWVVTANTNGINNAEARALTVDNEGNALVTGVFYGQLLLEDKTEIIASNSKTDADIFVTKISPAGALVWAKRIGNNNAVDEPKAIAADANGNVAVSGYFQGTVETGGVTKASSGDRDLLLVRYDKDGNQSWAMLSGGTGRDEARGLAVDTDGNFYLAGCYNATVDFDPLGTAAVNTSTGGYESFVAKYAGANGQLAWVKSFGSTLNDSSFGLAMNTHKNIYVSFFFKGTIELDATHSLVANASSYDNGLLKLTTTTSNVTPQNVDSNIRVVYTSGDLQVVTPTAQIEMYTSSGALIYVGAVNGELALRNIPVGTILKVKMDKKVEVYRLY